MWEFKGKVVLSFEINTDGYAQGSRQFNPGRKKFCPERTYLQKLKDHDHNVIAVPVDAVVDYERKKVIFLSQRPQL